MKVYFTAALRGRKLFLKNYETIVKYLRELGYEITEALFLEKPVVVLYARGGNHPTLLEGRKDEKLQMMEYDLGGLKKLLEQAMIEAEKMLDVRFNFFVNQKIRDYLERVA